MSTANVKILSPLSLWKEGKGGIEVKINRITMSMQNTSRKKLYT
jgi:hypothetical protein